MFYCKECGNESKKWYGRCPVCKEYNTFVEVRKVKKESLNNKKNYLESEIKLTKIKEIKNNDKSRVLTSIAEFDYVLGKGFVPGSLILLGGSPGVGKSTLILEVASNIANSYNLLYVSGEESLQQIKIRANRLQLDINDNLSFTTSKDVDLIIETSLKNDIKCLIIDSIQTIYSQEVKGIAGSTSQVKECTLRLMYFAKETNTTVIIIGHITKDGDIAGPKLLEHMVDVVLYLEGEKNTNYKILRTSKNRYGNVPEVGIFEMEDEGLRSAHSIENYFLNSNIIVPGKVVGCTIEGDRIFFCDVESLLIKTEYGFAKRTTQGYDLSRMNLLLGIIQKRLKINLSQDDCYLNVSGAIKNNERSLDLAVIMSLISSKTDYVLDKNNIFIGEVGLGGEIKQDQGIKKKIELAEKYGFKRIFCKLDPAIRLNSKEIKIFNCSTISEVWDFIKG